MVKLFQSLVKIGWAYKYVFVVHTQENIGSQMELKRYNYIGLQDAIDCYCYIQEVLVILIRRQTWADETHDSFCCLPLTVIQMSSDVEWHEIGFALN